MLLKQIKSWLDAYKLVIIPVDTTEMPIKRWKIELIGNSIRNTLFSDNPNQYGRDLDGKELTFRSDNRPAPQFLYFHFIMALIRIRDLEAQGWKETWAKYFAHQPFPTPGNYLPQSMLFVLHQHYAATDVEVLESWTRGQGFGKPITVSEEESKKIAERVKRAVAQSKKSGEGSNDTSEDESGDEDEDENDEHT